MCFSTGEAEGVRVLEGADKVERIHRARLLFLAAGAIETPRLLLNSRSPRFPHGLLNHHGLVGTHLMEIVYIARLYYFPERLASPAACPSMPISSILSPLASKGG